MTIIDFSHRLPGPWAGHKLALQGLKVTSLSCSEFPDPFEHPIGADGSFAFWQQQLQAKKVHHHARWDDQMLQFDAVTMKLLREAEGMIFSPAVDKQTYRAMKNAILHGIKAPWVMLEIAGKKNADPWHDLNAMAESGLLSLAEDTVPFLPVAGLMLGMQVALSWWQERQNAVAQNRAINQIIYLEDVVGEMGQVFLPPSKKDGEKIRALHNGRFACYKLYQLKDKRRVALAAIESRFWQQFIMDSSLALDPPDRFDESGRVQKMLQDYFLTLDEQQLIERHNLKASCLSLLK